MQRIKHCVWSLYVIGCGFLWQQSWSFCVVCCVLLPILKTGRQFNAFLDMQVDVGDNRIPLMSWSCCQGILWWYLKALLMTALGGCEVWFLHAGSSLSLDFVLFISHFASVNEAILLKLLKKRRKDETRSDRKGAGEKNCWLPSHKGLLTTCTSVW